MLMNKPALCQLCDLICLTGWNKTQEQFSTSLFNIYLYTELFNVVHWSATMLKPCRILCRLYLSTLQLYLTVEPFYITGIINAEVAFFNITETVQYIPHQQEEHICS